ncbi:FAD-dependent monooxygenase [Mycobacterium timonense]|uniref:2-polyprenyl-6-methoxyphenol hydroxylase n=2 Tax=Mycobacterium avium complex (MAC) TaxID=120793 RepID=A0AAW5SEH0_MYCBC|nr:MULTISPECIES: FAD-dependent monooxygenase [Mycobacterium avium complex (MAC)]MBZ4548685.1 2-polyprenyl-6-methoxyphenol hydroxylase [Mycobacterium avium subsp. hominissuis]MBZ4582117.1 2-polyprenyl-6-methoxyphenol hydroxylase [Mycobacterium avium subsp. hominissuis]MBZ4595980.1 2-polyprenyl-6-methoxyphenol hydroxylase [Mycobacterium avium subsp. hominissuis]MCV6993096.1 FAD-dependent monooxygenase [Mycobacterium bouchedurhonense]MCV6997017.1 FAD-dependent monooxygenase [Mycobacterium timonen
MDRRGSGSALLAGDAAHVHSPAGGQGMNLGITDAISLAAALAQIARGGPDTVLDAYGDAQRQRAERVLRLTGRLTRVATLPRPLRPLRNAGMRLAAGIPGVQRRLAVQLSGLGHR